MIQASALTIIETVHLPIHRTAVKRLRLRKLPRHRHIALDHRMRRKHLLRPALVRCKELLPVLRCCLPLCNLRRQWSDVRFTLCRKLRRHRSALQTAGAAAVTHTRVVDVGTIHHRNIALVDIVIHRARIHMVAVTVVLKVIVIPIAALVADADKAKAVIDTAIVPHMAAPIPPVEAISPARVAPPSRRP